MIEPYQSREMEALSIFATHGVLDASVTVVGAATVGTQIEGNPLMRHLLEEGYGWAFGTMLILMGLAALAWPTAADAVDMPWQAALIIALLGLLVATLNLVAIALAAGWFA